MKKLFLVFIVLTLTVFLGFAEEGVSSQGLPEVELGTLSDTEITKPAAPGLPKAPEDYPMALQIMENGEDTGYGVQMRDVESEYLNYEQHYTTQQNFNPVFDSIFVKYDLANLKAEGELLEIYAIKNNITVDALKLEEETNNIVAEVTATPEYKEQILTNYGSIENFYQFVKMVKKEEMLRTKVINTVAPFNQEQIEKAFIEKQADIVAQYERVKTSHILVETREEALSIKERIEAGEITFQDAATQYSIDSGTAKAGGMLGWVNRGKTVPEFEVAAFSGELGEITPPVKSQFGYHLVLPEEKTNVRTLEQFKQMEEEYTQFTQTAQQELLMNWLTNYKKEKNITYKYFDYLESIESFGKFYTQSVQTMDFSVMIDFLKSFQPSSINDRAFYEVALQSLIQLSAQDESLFAVEDVQMLEDKRLENLKKMSSDEASGFAALSRYYSLNPNDTRMAIKFFDAFISEALYVAQNEDFMTTYGDQIIAQLMQAHPQLKEIAENPSADSRDRVIAYMYLIRINKITGETDMNQEFSARILELDPGNEEVLKLLEDN